MSSVVGSPSAIHLYHWLIHTDSGLAVRTAAGALIFAILALLDFRRFGRGATRWREYAFLLVGVGVAMLYGCLNDLVTSHFSWEYFVYGKGLIDLPGITAPPAPGRLAFEAAKIGIKATWSAGLVVGAALLIANNPSRHKPQLPYRRMLRLLPIVFFMCVVCGAVMGVIGYLGGLVAMSPDFAPMLRGNEMRPRRFMAVYGIHLGSYLGGLLGTIVAVIAIRRGRRTTHGA